MGFLGEFRFTEKLQTEYWGALLPLTWFSLM